MLKKQLDLIFIRESNYIENPKPNGYRSHHVILGVNVCCLDANEYYPVEIQLRTISMDFWAAMEHRVSYKKHYDNKEQRVAELLQYSNILEKMELYYDVKIIVKDTSLFKDTYTGKFRQRDSLDDVFRVLQQIRKFKVEKDTERNIVTLK